MVTVYTDADYLSAIKQKKKIWWVFMSVTLCYLAICIGLVVYHISLPYASPKATLPKWIVYVLSAAYMIFTFPFMAIKFSRCSRYVKMLTYVSMGLKNEETNYFYCFDEKELQKDNVDVMACVFETWSKKKSEWMEREAYFDPEKPLPPFESGDLVRYIVQSNFVIEYEILQKKALEFEEVEDEYEYEEDAEEEADEEENEAQAEENEEE